MRYKGCGAELYPGAAPLEVLPRSSFLAMSKQWSLDSFNLAKNIGVNINPAVFLPFLI